MGWPRTRIIMHSKKHWAPDGGVKVQRVARTVAGGWIVFGSLVEQGICPYYGAHSRRRHGWRHGRLQVSAGILV